MPQCLPSTIITLSEVIHESGLWSAYGSRTHPYQACIEYVRVRFSALGH